MKKDFYINNRDKVLNKIKDNSLFILFAGTAPKKLLMRNIHLHQIEIFIT